MPPPAHRSRQRAHPARWRALGLALVLTGAVAGTATATAAPPAGPGSTAGAAASEKLDQLRREITRVSAEQRTARAARKSIDAQLAQQAHALNLAARSLRDTDKKIASHATALTALQAQYQDLDAHLATQRAALAELLRASYALERSPELALLLGDADVANAQRALAYSRFLQRDRQTRIDALRAQIAQLEQAQASMARAAAALHQQRAQRAAHQTQLEHARRAQQQLLATADRRLAARGEQLAALQSDAQALDHLLRRLHGARADIPAQPGQAPAFASLRGKLPWPVAGSRRRAAAAMQPGLVIAAATGSDVHAVAYGRVAYANFMRGFGMLVIIDHGGGWMSLYGGNEATLVEAGDWVTAGQVIASVGRDAEQGGAWFGLRHQGQPVEPADWFAGRH